MLFGLDYALTESVSLGIKGRRAAFGTFTDSSALDRLRSHPSNKRRDGSEPVTSTFVFDGIALYGIGVHLRCRF